MLVALWTLPAVVVTGQLYVQLQAAGRSPSWVGLLQFQLLRWWPWALLTPWLERLARRWRPAPPGRARSVAVLVAVGAVLLPLKTAYGMFVDLTLLQGIWMEPGVWLERAARGSLVGLPVFLVIYGGILALTWARDFRDVYQRREREAEQLRSALAEARLQSLQLQLQPHFLFNTLHTITSLMDEDVPRARRMTARLGTLLRATLELSDEPLVPLRDEVRLAELYLDIEQARFEDRLHVDWRIPEHLLDCQVPTLTLQPLVENSVRHGVGARPGGGRIAIRAEGGGDGMRIEVEDNGVGPPAAPRFGTGLSSIQRRIEGRYGDRAALRLETNASGGCTAIVTLPRETRCAS